MKHTKRFAALLTALCLTAAAALAYGESTPGEPAACKHPNATTTVEQKNVRYTAMDERTHTVGYDEVTTVDCPDCEEGDSVVTVYKQSCEAHKIQNGTCALCGYKEPATPSEPRPKPKPTPKPAPKPTPKPAPTAAPQPTAAPDAPDAVAAPMPELARMLFSAYNMALLESENVSVRIAGADQLFTLEEQAALELLAPEERMMLTLSAVGMGDITDAALEAMAVTLSPEAKALDEQIAARMAAMTDEEQSALAALLDAYFPLTEVAIDGVVCPLFTLDLAVVTQDGPRVQRYSFSQDEQGRWSFYEYVVIEGEEAAESETIQSSEAG